MLRMLRLTHDSGLKANLDSYVVIWVSIHFLPGTLARFIARVHCYETLVIHSL